MPSADSAKIELSGHRHFALPLSGLFRQEYLYQQQLAEKQAAAQTSQYGGTASKNKAQSQMYDSTNKAQSFQSLYEQLQQQLKQQPQGYGR